jgi:hypothetical protein
MPKVNQLLPNFSSGTKAPTNTIAGKISGVVSNFIPNNGNFSSFAGGINPADSRLSLAGLLPSGTGVPKSFTQNPGVQFGSSQDSDNDWRVRVSINPNSKILYWDTGSSGSVPGLVAPLKATNGFIFPYVPQVTVSHSANYQSQQLTHSNYAQYFYESSSVAAISISGDFTVQNIDEARYFLAGIYYFRALTKMFYGLSGDYQGSPPPIVYLDGFGQHYLPHVPCVVTSFIHSMPNDVDYLEIQTPQSQSVRQVQTASTYFATPGQNNSMTIDQVSINSAYNRVPTASTFSITLQPVISRTQAIDFNYKEFARGGLITGKGSPYPGGYL